MIYLTIKVTINPNPGATDLKLVLVKSTRPPTTLGDHKDSPDKGRGEVL